MSDKPAFDSSTPYSLTPEAAVTNAQGAVTSKPGFDPNTPFETGEEHYGTLGQQALTIAEGAGQGLIGGIAPALEEASGLTTGEDIRNRAAINPIEHYGSEAVGFTLPALATGGLSAEASTALAASEGITQAATRAGSFLPQLAEATLPSLAANIGNTAKGIVGLEGVAGAAVKGAAEFTALGASNEATKWITQDPDQSLGSAAINIGFSGLLGGLGGAAFESASNLWSARNAEKVGNMVEGIKTQSTADAIEPKTLTEALTELKDNAPEIKAAAEQLGAPLLESQISKSKTIQDLDSYLINTSASPIGAQRQALLQQGVNKAEGAISEALGPPVEASTVDVANTIRDSLEQKIEAQYKPIQDLYAQIKESTGNIELGNAAKGQLSRGIKELEDYTLPGQVQKLGNTVIDNLDNINSVDQVQRLKKILTGSLSFAATPEERRAVGLITSKLDAASESAIGRAGEKLVNETADPATRDAAQSLLDNWKSAKSQYKDLSDTLRDLGQSIGKKNISGPADFLEHLSTVPAEKLASSLFSKGNSAALQTFAGQFPEESQMLFNSVKSGIRDAATRDGVLNVGSALKAIDKLSPEVQGLLFPEAQLSKLQAAKTYFESIPFKVNPSGTAKAGNILKFFTNPISSSLMTVADFGVQKAIRLAVPKSALKSLIGNKSEEEFAENIFPLIEKNVIEKETKPGALKQTIDYLYGVYQGQKRLDTSVGNFFAPAAKILSTSLIPNERDRDQLSRQLDKFSTPQNVLNEDNNGHYLPEHSAALMQKGMSAYNYLNSLKPDSQKAFPLDQKMAPNKFEQERYNRALDIAQQPLLVLQHAKNGMLTNEDMQTMNVVWPGFQSNLKQKLSQEMLNQKNLEMNAGQRQSFAVLMGAPVDSTMSAQSLQSILFANRPAQAARPNGAQYKTSQSTLSQMNKVNNLYSNGLDARLTRKASAK